MNDLVNKVLKSFAPEAMIHERIVNYMVREVHRGRKIDDIMSDPFVKNRIDDETVERLLQDPEVIRSIEEELIKAFKEEDFGFAD